jgi:hypothetical protein
VRALLFGLVATALVAACGDRELDRLTRVRDRACTCHDLKCAEAALGDVPTGEVHPTPHAQALANEIFRCVAHLKAVEPETGRGSDDAQPGSGSG